VSECVRERRERGKGEREERGKGGRQRRDRGETEGEEKERGERGRESIDLRHSVTSSYIVSHHHT